MNLAPDTLAPFDPMEFRRALGTFPTGVAIITTCGLDGQPVGLTCNSFSSVSLDPPLVLWSLRRASKSLPAFRGASHFAINVLAEDQRELSARFASSSVPDKFAGTAYSTGHGGVPLIDNCLARFHCSTYAEYEAGDHYIFVGRVERFEHAREDDPLVFYKGAYMILAQSLRDLASDGRMSMPALIEARLNVYGVLLRLACQKGSPEDFDAIEAHLDAMETLKQRGDMASRARAAVDFFNLITQAAHNDVLSIVAQSLRTLMHHAVHTQAAEMSWPAMHQPELTPLRRRMLECLRARDQEGALAAMETYFGHVQRFQNQRKTAP
ncbi:flavin reductase [Bordetella petrii]|uniref:flavin reductase n=1 Tax=Bordetella petrii TaxID=94624 RepID=UPI001E285865|nr:flavin reductase [Bordetella petrii]MCD0503796.1 flavin reductase [Bordetella petrii]